MSEPIRFGWFIPTSGDTTSFSDPEQAVAPSMELFLRVAQAAEDGGFDYVLVPVQTACWDALVTCAMVVAKTERLDALLAARVGFVAPTVLAKMFSTFDQLSGGRLRINLIAGGSTSELAADGMFDGHDDRYEIMDEAVRLMKRVWTERGPVDHHGKHFRVERARVRPRPFQQPHPPFYLGGNSAAAMQIAAAHADVQLFWGDRPEIIAQRIEQLDQLAATQDRDGPLRYGMRLQVVLGDTEDAAWASAHRLIDGATELQKRAIATMWDQSVSNARMVELAKEPDHLLGPHLWSGISTVRPGAGVAVVGDAEQVAATLHQFVAAGCSEFCLSGYPHEETAAQFSGQVMPILLN